MCGIVGKLLFDPQAAVDPRDLGAMLAPIAHRGPDGHGILVRGNAGLGHRRLAIIDVDGGAQPLANEDGTVHVTFNGEIYNFRELRAGLLARGHVFRTHSDTEVIVHLYEEHGPAFVSRLEGMFAFALWDSRRRRLVLARDRVGIKPLYYTVGPDHLAFASELKSLLPGAAMSRDLDAAALGRFLAFHYVPGDATLFAAVRKLLPAHYLLAERGRVTLRRYWDLDFTRADPAPAFPAATAALRDLVAETVRRHLIADVPVGVLLSGGVDSSVMLALAAAESPAPVPAFTVGFAGPGLVDERPFARLIARRHGADHHEITLTAEDFWSFLPAYAWHMEEPVCEPPAVALYHVTRLARGHVKVLLSGEGGDEAFAGYPNYAHQLRVRQLGRWLGPLSRPAGAWLAGAGDWLGSDRARRYGAALGRPLPEFYFSRTSSPASFFNRRRSQFLPAGARAADRPADFIAGLLATARTGGLLDEMLYVDTRTWLPDDLLLKADKMTMANSVELRVPLLDHHVLEFAASLPAAFKVAGGATKRVLKAAFAPLLPAEILRRPKAGFPVPYEAWLRGPLAARVRDTLSAGRSLTRSFLPAREVDQLLRAHLHHGRNGREVFSLLALEFWHRAFVDAAPAAVSARRQVA